MLMAQLRRNSHARENNPRVSKVKSPCTPQFAVSTPPTYRLPSAAEVQHEQKQDEYTSHIRQALQQYQNGETQTHSDEQWARDNEADYVIQDVVLKKAWVKGKGKAAITVWQTVGTANLRANLIQAFHTSERNSHYGDLKTFTHI